MTSRPGEAGRPVEGAGAAPTRAHYQRPIGAGGGAWPRGACEALRLLISSALVVAALAMLAYLLPVYPPIGSDEWWLLGRSHEILREFGFTDKVASDMELRGLVRSPVPPMNIPLRYVVHKALGAGVEIDRPISAVQFATVGLLFALLAWRLGAPPAVAALGLPVFLLCPGVFFVARSFRYEQDIFFLGAVGMVLSFLLLRPTRWAVPIALAAGTATGMASVMHLFGIAFGASVLLAAGALRLVGRTRLPRPVVGAWLASFAVPVLLTVAYFVTDGRLQEFAGRGLVVRVGEEAQLASRMAFLRGLFPPLAPWLPDRVTETVNALRWGLLPQPPAAQRELTAALMTGLGVAVAAAAYLGLGFVVARRFRRLGHARRRAADSVDTSDGVRPGAFAGLTGVLAAAWLAPVLLLAISFARPHTDYVVYVHGSAMLACFLLVAVGARAGRRWWTGAGARWLVLVVVVAVELAYLGPLLASRREPPNGSMAVQIRAMRQVSAALGLDIDASGGLPIYGDIPSWPATGVRHVPLFDHVILERVGRRPEIAGVVLDPDWYNGMASAIPPAGDRPPDPARRRALMASLVDDLDLAAVLRFEPDIRRNPETRFWYLRSAPSPPLFGIVERDGTLRLEQGLLVADVVERVDAGAGRTNRSVRLEPGEYFALVSGGGLTASRLRATSRRQEFNGIPLDAFPQERTGARAWIDLERSGDVRFELDTVASAPSEARLRIWRLR